MVREEPQLRSFQIRNGLGNVSDIGSSRSDPVVMAASSLAYKSFA